MSLADDLDGHQADRSIEQILELLEPADRDALLRALTDRKGQRADGAPLYRWSDGKLSRRLYEEGWRVNNQQIARWRRTHVTS